MAKIVPLGTLIDQMFNVREKKRVHEAEISKIEKEMALLEAALIERMDAETVDSSRGKLATASITTSVVPNVEDWDKFYAYLHKNKYYHLLERRPSVTGCRELFEKKGAIPGVVPFTKRKLNLRVVG